MPELPEIETIRRDLESRLHRCHLVDAQIHDQRLMSPTAFESWKSVVLGQTWESFCRRGKYLLVSLYNGYRIVFHLRMTGQLVLGPQPATSRPRLSMRFNDGKCLSFCDQRRFGEVWLLKPDQSWHSKREPGPDALTELDLASFRNILKGRSTRIQPLLMDQQRLAGVGNIYAQEALFKAGIRPSRPANRISQAERHRLFDALRKTLLDAIAHRGSTSRNYLDAFGHSGTAQTLHAVYRKGGRPCLRCASTLKAIRVGGRGSVYCGTCQR